LLLEVRRLCLSLPLQVFLCVIHCTFVSARYPGPQLFGMTKRLDLMPFRSAAEDFDQASLYVGVVILPSMVNILDIEFPLHDFSF